MLVSCYKYIENVVLTRYDQLTEPFCVAILSDFVCNCSKYGLDSIPEGLIF